MGDMADAMVNGGCCLTGCGTWFVEEHGYPVLCAGCWSDVPRADIERRKIMGTRMSIQTSTGAQPARLKQAR